MDERLTAMTVELTISLLLSVSRKWGNQGEPVQVVENVLDVGFN